MFMYFKVEFMPEVVELAITVHKLKHIFLLLQRLFDKLQIFYSVRIEFI